MFGATFGATFGAESSCAAHRGGPAAAGTPL